METPKNRGSSQHGSVIKMTTNEQIYHSFFQPMNP